MAAAALAAVARLVALGVTPAPGLAGGASRLLGVLPEYRAKSGLLDVGVFAQVVYPLSDHWTVFSKLQVNTLEGDAKKSPLVERRTAPTFLLFGSYTF